MWNVSVSIRKVVRKITYTLFSNPTTYKKGICKLGSWDISYNIIPFTQHNRNGLVYVNLLSAR